MARVLGWKYQSGPHRVFERRRRVLRAWFITIPVGRWRKVR